MPQKQFSGDSRSRSFVLDFWRFIAAIFARIGKLISPLNSANFSTSDRTDEINLWNSKLIADLGFANWDSYAVVCDPQNQKAHLPIECTLSIGNWFALKLFPLGYAQFTGNSAVSALDPPSLETSFLLNGRSSPLPTHLCVCHRDRADLYVVYNWSYGALQCFSYAWIRPWNQFSGDILTTFGRIWQVISFEFSAFFYFGQDGQHKFSEPIFRVRGFPYDVLHIWWVETVKRHTFWLYTF